MVTKTTPPVAESTDVMYLARLFIRGSSASVKVTEFGPEVMVTPPEGTPMLLIF